MLPVLNRRSVMATALVLTLTACASVEQRHARDPFEPVNRVVFSFNQKADRYVIQPVAEGYKTVTPEPVRVGVSNVFDNMKDIVSFANHAVQLKPKEALNDFFRVAVNTVFGFGGLLDIASPMGLKSQKSGFGDTLAHYGWKNSDYVMLPLLGPSTVRDTIGTGVDFVSNPLDHYVQHDVPTRNTLAGVNVINQRARLLGSEKLLEEAALDPYSLMRDTYLQMRDKKVGLPSQAEEDIPINELVNP